MEIKIKPLATLNDVRAGLGGVLSCNELNLKFDDGYRMKIRIESWYPKHLCLLQTNS